MTNEKAIEHLSRMFYDSYNEHMQHLATGGNADTYHKEYMDAISLAITALEMQIPEKPFDTQKEGYYTSEFDFACPSCSTWFTHKHNYCPVCGQKLDWSGEE